MPNRILFFQKSEVRTVNQTSLPKPTFFLRAEFTDIFCFVLLTVGCPRLFGSYSRFVKRYKKRCSWFSVDVCTIENAGIPLFCQKAPGKKRFETPAGTCLVKINSYLYGCFRILSVMKKEWNDVREFTKSSVIRVRMHPVCWIKTLAQPGEMDERGGC